MWARNWPRLIWQWRPTQNLFAKFFTGAYASDFWRLGWRNVGETIRHQHRIGAGRGEALFNIVPEAAVYLGKPGCLFNCEIDRVGCNDALCVSGLTAERPHG
ncbi:hypothetical protein KCP69_16150 [Salmonella enterica subsp. enterica]|nr:hypothetical protein KCP69_16150 [Salmonella enterica subsp. enterica]